MSADTWFWILGVPVVIALAVLAARRARAVTERTIEVQDELARSPLPPFAQLAELVQEQKSVKGTDGTTTRSL